MRVAPWYNLLSMNPILRIAAALLASCLAACGGSHDHTLGPTDLTLYKVAISTTTTITDTGPAPTLQRIGKPPFPAVGGLDAKALR
jgi:hypothetical protein